MIDVHRQEQLLMLPLLKVKQSDIINDIIDF